MAKVTLKKVEKEEEIASKELEITQPVQTELRAKRKCPFCESKLTPTYLDSATLKKHLSDRSRIIGKLRSKLCSKHQRRVGREIKRARFLSLLPYIASV